MRELKPHKISAGRATILFAIEALGDEATPSKIAEGIFREPHSISIMLSNLEKKGLVNKKRLPGQRNKTRVTLTKKGKELLKQLQQMLSVQEIMASLSDNELDLLKSILLKLWHRSQMILRKPVHPALWKWESDPPKLDILG